ncbi:MAG: hypothetical protein WBB85_09440 [Albidovulum sp.]|uniref:hypothetical protein n=1 Tax=Albidovulum sp. TaxID=1872424 RepID=UPI003CA1F3C3
MNLRHFLRMAQWARNPPSAKRVALVFGVVALCLLLAGLEWAGVVPDGFGLAPGGDKPRIKTLP